MYFMNWAKSAFIWFYLFFTHALNVYVSAILRGLSLHSVDGMTVALKYSVVHPSYSNEFPMPSQIKTEFSWIVKFIN